MAMPMQLYVLLIAFLPLTTSDNSTVLPTSGQETALQPDPTTQETTADSLNKIYTAKISPPTTEALRIVTIKATTQISETQNKATAKLEVKTNYATRDGQISPVYSTEVSTAHNGSTENTDLTTSVIQNADTQAFNSSQSAISSTPSGFTNLTPTSTVKTPTVVVPTENATTGAVPTAKLSATTEMKPSVQNTTDLSETTEPGQTTNLVSTVKLSTTPRLVTVTTQAQTTTKIHPPTVNDATTPSKDGQKAVKHGKIVAGLIGGALILMMIGFLVILYKKHKLKKHQITTTDWAGPTPFLDTGGGEGNGHVTLRSASRISLTSFLPQRLSKRLSLLAESAEEMHDMQEMTTGTTFAVKEKKNETSDQTFDKSNKEANENKSESSQKTEEVVLVDETKDTEKETSKEQQNGQATMKDNENGRLENDATQPPPEEDPVTEPEGNANSEEQKQ